MSILICDMTMPKNGCVHLSVNSDGKVFTDFTGEWAEYEAIEVPPHGDLIDREFMRKRIDGSGYVEQIKGNLFYMLELAPTIIEAEGEQ